MSYELPKNQDPLSYKALLDENSALQAEIKSLKARLEEAEELSRAISEGDLDALVIPSSKGELIFTLDSADQTYRVLVETMSEGTATLACDGTILYCNRHFAELLKAPLQTVIGTSIYQFVVLENEPDFRELLKQQSGREEIYLINKEGSSIPVYLSVSSLKAEGSPNAWCLVATDLTEQKKNEEMLAALENSRKKEIHHRIKNNLQVISSLLDLQAEKLGSKECIASEEVLEAFKESQNRVASIALIHEELYKGGNVNELQFPAYLKELAKSLLKTYSLGKVDITLNMELEQDIFFDMDIAVPLGIIVNELITNSVKYAFSGRKTGEIQIKLLTKELLNKQDEKEGFNEDFFQYTLIVSDNGIGIPNKVDFGNSDTLGLQLVNILIEQLGGTIELKRENGTEYTICFNITNEE